MKDLNKFIDDIFKTIDVSVVPLRIKGISIDVFLSLSWLPEMLLKSATTTAMIGRIVGKNAATVRPWNECNAQLYGLEERLKVHIGNRNEGVYVIIKTGTFTDVGDLKLQCGRGETVSFADLVLKELVFAAQGSIFLRVSPKENLFYRTRLILWSGCVRGW